MGGVFPRIRLRIGIALMFLGIMLPLISLMTVVLYRQNVRLAYDVAQSAMDGATRNAVVEVRNLLVPMARVIDMSVAYGQASRHDLRKLASLRPMVESLDAFPDIYAMFLGFGRDGAFYEVIRIPPPGSPGIRGRHPPPGARYALRIKDKVGDDLVDSYIYIAKWGEVLGVERAPTVTYDPRPRSWYKAAVATDGIATSGLHVFTSIGRPGLTLSRRLATEDGEVIGVYAADLSTATLSTILDHLRIGRDGVVFILDEDGRLLGYPHPDLALTQHGGEVEVAKAEDVADRVVADAVRLRRIGMGDRFSAPLGAEGRSYLVSFTPFPANFGRQWTIGVIAAESDFVGPIRRASVKILLIGVVFLMATSVAVMWLSRMMTRPILRLTEEAERIRDLDFAGEIQVRSRVVEIHALAVALGSMKNGLRSFGTYVPKNLVRSIIHSGRGTEIGGERLPLTVLFSDIGGYAQTSEFMAPEDMARQLSVYLEIMSGLIGANGGTVDKFIGDAVMAMWNAPDADADHVANACRAALACRAVAAAGDDPPAVNRFLSMPTRFGLHSGTAMVGNVGSSDRMQYTALGAAVNLASRIEGLNKVFATTILATGAVEAAVRDRFLFRPFGPVVAAGTSVPVDLFELVAALEPGAAQAADEPVRARCRAWTDAFALYAARDWPAAAEAFRGYYRTFPEDSSGHLLLARSLAYAASPPPPDWDGAIRFDEK